MTALPGPFGLSTALALWVTGVCVAVLTTSVRVALRYAVALRKAPAGAGPLLWHVVVIAFGMALIVSGVGLAMLQDFGVLTTPRELRLGMYGTGFTLIFVALLILLRGINRRVSYAAARVRVTPPDFVPRRRARRRPTRRDQRADTQPDGVPEQR